MIHNKTSNEKPFMLTLKYGGLGIAVPKGSPNLRGIEKVVFDCVGNLDKVDSAYGSFYLNHMHSTRLVSDMNPQKTDNLVRAAYKSARLALKRLANKSSSDKADDIFKEVLGRICEYGYETYKKRENFEGWTKFIPPFEHPSLLLYNEVMRGCPKSQNNPCIFCNLYKNEPFEIVPFDEFAKRERELAKYAPRGLEYLRTERLSPMFSFLQSMISKDASDEVKSIIWPEAQFFWGSGNIFALKPDELLKRFEEHNKYFTFDSDNGVGGINAFGHSRFLLNHASFLKRYHELGLRRVWLGVESGDDVSLRVMNKSATAEDHLRAGKALNDADIFCDVSILYSGIDANLLDAHIRETKRLIYKMQPACVYFVDLIVHDGTKLSELVKQQKIILPKGKSLENMGFASVGGVPAWNYDIPV